MACCLDGAIFIQEDASENVIWKMVVILPQPEWVACYNCGYISTKSKIRTWINTTFDSEADLLID